MARYETLSPAQIKELDHNQLRFPKVPFRGGFYPPEFRSYEFGQDSEEFKRKHAQSREDFEDSLQNIS